MCWGDLGGASRGRGPARPVALHQEQGPQFQALSRPEVPQPSHGEHLGRAPARLENGCGLGQDGSKLSFYSLAPTSSAFSDLLPVCQLGGPMEQDHRTILHLAAEKNFSEPMEEA